MTTSHEIQVYTDGAASPNPGKGGYGVVILQNGHRRELSGGFRLTTNNRMEIRGVIVGLKALTESTPPKCKVTIYSDSKYVVDMFNGGYAASWRRQGWTRNKGKDKALNPDLWDDLLTLAQSHDLKMVWVRGHADNPENSRCDELAVMARQGSELPEDEGYVKPFVPGTAAIPEVGQLLLFRDGG